MKLKRIEPDRYWWTRWYGAVPLVLTGVGLCGFLTLIFWMSIWRNDVLVYATLFTFFLQPIGIAWIIWLTPWLASGDLRARWSHKPSEFARGLTLLIMLPPLCLGGTAIGIIVIVLVTEWLSYHDWNDLTHLLITWIIIFCIALVILAPSTIYAKKVKCRVRRNTVMRQLCFECGYDLRGNPDAEHCPECGAAVEKIP